MTKIGDERIAFYLENRRQIDEWARLKTEAVDAVYAVFQQLGEKLEAAVSGLDGAPLLMPFLESSYPATPSSKVAGRRPNPIGACQLA